MHGRAEEERALDSLLAAARAGRSGVLVVRGAPGVGKSALLAHLGDKAADPAAADGPVRVIRSAGIEFEAELPFAGLHALLHPALDRLAALPAPQADALRAAFGLAPAEPGDRFLVGLAVLSLLAELAGDGTLLCVVDDAHWLDRASAEALVFAARRLTGEGVLLLFGARETGDGHPLTGLPELRLEGLGRAAAIALLAETGPDLADGVRERILAETGGNPLALIELPNALTPGQRAGRLPPLAFHLGPLPLTARLRSAFGAQADRLPEPSRTLLLIAALEETGDLDVILRAAASLGAGAADAEAAERSGLLRATAGGVTFRHPLARAAVIQAAPLHRRLDAHRALAAALASVSTGAPNDAADRRAWHLAAAATGPDERAAAALEQAADRARRRTGYAAQAMALERAAELTPDPAVRARRLVAAAEAAADSGEPRRALALAGRAAEGPADALLAARVAHVRAMVEFDDGSPLRAAELLIDGASSLDGEHADKATAMLMEAVRDAYFAGHAQLARIAADRLLSVGGDTPFTRALDGLARLIADDPAAAVHPMNALPESVLAAGSRGGAAPGPHRPSERLIAGAMGMMTGDEETASRVLRPLVADARAGGLVGWLPNLLEHLAITELHLGRHQDARAHAQEALSLAESIGQSHRADHLRCVLAWLAAAAGNEEECLELAEPAVARAAERHILRTTSWGSMAIGMLELVRGRHEQALDRLDAAADGPLARHSGSTFLVHLAPDQVEAAVRGGQPGRAAGPLAKFARWAEAADRPWAHAVTLRCRALTAPVAEAGPLYAQAVELHALGGRPFERARTQLLYGEWLRRARRKTEARSQLRSALEAFERMGATAWSERTRGELRASGVPQPRTAVGSGLDRLTPQELQVVRLATDGLSNRDIAAQLFLSPRTVGYHLYKAYPKLGITSRRELATLAHRAADG
ncbi:ATP-binding protein [Streptomyces sparsogenes]|uniref:ATP-binding protein n=1 Tax=Streptomyces sparsogenes TaxID=67365 RepID=UPI0033CDE0E8